MWLLAGLGNPGPEHERNRHNVGYMALDRFVQRHWPLGNWRRRFQGEAMDFTLGGEKILALKPVTYMNLSGNSVGEAAEFFKLPAEAVIALHDDLDLPFGRIELKKGGGHGGHNGLKSLDALLGQGYWRIRLGIGHPLAGVVSPDVPREVKQQAVLGHVLGNFSKDEAGHYQPALEVLAETLPILLAGDADGFRRSLRDAMQSLEH